MVGGYTEDLTKPQNCQNGGQRMHRNGHLLVYTFIVAHKENVLIDW